MSGHRPRSRPPYSSPLSLLFAVLILASTPLLPLTLAQTPTPTPFATTTSDGLFCTVGGVLLRNGHDPCGSNGGASIPAGSAQYSDSNPPCISSASPSPTSSISSYSSSNTSFVPSYPGGIGGPADLPSSYASFLSTSVAYQASASMARVSSSLAELSASAASVSAARAAATAASVSASARSGVGSMQPVSVEWPMMVWATLACLVVGARAVLVL